MSTIKVDRIEPQDGLQTNAMGGIVQVVRVVHTGQVSSNSATYVSTGLQASIKPRSASNKIMVSFEHSIYHANSLDSDTWSLHGIKIKRGTQTIYTPASNSYGPYDFGIYDSDNANKSQQYNRSRVEYLDSPGVSGSLITYSTEIAVYQGLSTPAGGTVYVNFLHSSTTSAPQSFMTLTEITA
jgi:hypothetical protein